MKHPINFLVGQAVKWKKTTENGIIFPENTINFHLQFKIEILSPELGFSEKTILLEMMTSNKILMN